MSAASDGINSRPQNDDSVFVASGTHRVFWEEKFYALLPVCLMLTLPEIMQFMKSLQCSRAIACFEQVLKSIGLTQLERFYFKPPTDSCNRYGQSAIMHTHDEGQLFALWRIYDCGAPHPVLDSEQGRDMYMKATATVKKELYNKGRWRLNHVVLDDLLYLMESADEGLALRALESKYNTDDLNLSLKIGNSRNKTLLHVAVQKRFVRALEAILKSGNVDANATCDIIGCNTTALHLAVNMDSYECAKLLIDAGADVNFCGGDQYPPLHYAANKRRSRCMPLLLERGASVNDYSLHSRALGRPSLVDRAMYWSHATDTLPSSPFNVSTVAQPGTISLMLEAMTSRFKRHVLRMGQHRDYDFVSIADFHNFARKEIRRLEKEDAKFPEYSDEDRKIPLTFKTLVDHGALPSSLRHLHHEEASVVRI